VYVVLGGNASCQPVACNAQGENAVVGRDYYPTGKVGTFDFRGYVLPADSSEAPTVNVSVCRCVCVLCRSRDKNAKPNGSLHCMASFASAWCMRV
jgi:hypothetical protein